MIHGTTDALAWALVHFLWQGAGIALAAFVAGALLRRRGPETRYALYCAALALMALAPLATFFAVRLVAPHAMLAATAASVAQAPAGTMPAIASEAPVDWLPALVRIWLAGVLVLGLRALGGWILAQRLKIWKTTPAAEPVRQAAVRLGARLGVRRAVRVLSSALAGAPAAVGWIR